MLINSMLLYLLSYDLVFASFCPFPSPWSGDLAGDCRKAVPYCLVAFGYQTCCYMALFLVGLSVVRLCWVI